MHLKLMKAEVGDSLLSCTGQPAAYLSHIFVHGWKATTVWLSGRIRNSNNMWMLQQFCLFCEKTKYSGYQWESVCYLNTHIVAPLMLCVPFHGSQNA